MINDKCECKKRHAFEKDHNPSTCSCKNGKYFASIMDDSVIMCDEVLESYDKETKAFQRNLKKRKANFYILIAFLLITKALLIAVSI